MNTKQTDWIQCISSRRKIFLFIDSVPADARQSLDLIRNAAMKGFAEARASFGDEFDCLELEVTHQPPDRSATPALQVSIPDLRLVERGDSPLSEQFEISWSVVRALGEYPLLCVFRDTFRNLMKESSRRQHSQSRLIRSLRHQFGNLLFRITARLDQARSLSASNDMDPVFQRIRELIGGAERALLRSEPLLQNLALLGGETIQPRQEAIRSSVQSALVRFKVLAEEWKVGVRIEGATPPGVQSEPHLVHAIWVILENALQAQLREPGGTIEVRASEAGGLLSVNVRDEGPGIDMEPPFELPGVASRAERDAGRPGLGLLASSRILEAYGGRLLYRSRSGKGAEFLVELPISI